MPIMALAIATYTFALLATLKPSCATVAALVVVVSDLYALIKNNAPSAAFRNYSGRYSFKPCDYCVSVIN